MKMKISPVLLCLLSVMALVLVCFLVMPSEEVAGDHAGHNHAIGETHTVQTVQTVQTVPTNPTHNKAAKDSYTCTENKDGTYSYQVTMRNGAQYESQENYAEKPTFTALSQDVLMVSGALSKENNLSGWAAYYDVKHNLYPNIYRAVLANTDNRIAYLYGEKGEFFVAVCDPFRPSTAEKTKLDGLTLSESGNPVIDYQTLKNGDLQITYTVDGAEKTVTIEMK